MINILVTFRDIEYLGKLIMGILPVYKGYLPVYFKGYGIWFPSQEFGFCT